MRNILILGCLFFSGISHADEKVELMHTYFNSVTLLNEGVDIRINGLKSNSRKEAQVLARKLRACDLHQDQKQDGDEYTLNGQTCAIDHTSVVTQLPNQGDMQYARVEKTTNVLDPDVTRNNILLDLETDTNYEYLPGPFGSQVPDIYNYETTAKSTADQLGVVEYTASYTSDNRVTGREKVSFKVVVQSENLNAVAEYKALGSRETCKLDGAPIDCFELAYALGAVEED